MATLAAAASFARRLDRLGVRFGLPEALVGLLTALAADGPELASAVVALAQGHKDVGLGVVLGSNVFNLAAMLGVGALVAGTLQVRAETVVLEGAVAVLVTGIAAALVFGALPAYGAVLLLGAVLVPYVAVITLGPRLPLGRLLRVEVRRALGPHLRGSPDEHPARTMALMVPAVAVIVLGSIGMVQSALALGDRWSVPRFLVGTLVLAGLTSLPNAFTAIRLARLGRGEAVVSETMNSNTINLVGGIAIPALFLSLPHGSGLLAVDVVWLVAMTLLSLEFIARRGRGRPAGLLLLLAYVAFVAVQGLYG